jgi:hypothetical protein
VSTQPKIVAIEERIVTIRVSDVVFRKDLYPRGNNTSAETVQKYAEDLSVHPPIEINQHNELIDGWHRWTAHKKNKEETLQATVTETASDAELLELAIERNAKHGLPLEIDDKERLAIRLWLETPTAQREEKEARLCKILSVGPRRLARFLSRAKKETKERAQKLAFDLWLSCHTQEEIAKATESERSTIEGWIKGFDDFGHLSESVKAAANHVTDFHVPIYNIWNQGALTNGVKHFGNSEQHWLDNRLYLYTRPFDTVIDCFAGGGSTIDVCKKRLRRYWVSDRLPVPEREHEIRKHDMTVSLPPLPRWADVKLVFLDPPYWRQAEGKYSKDAEDLANMPLEKFTETLAGIINSFAKKLSAGAVIALMMAPTHWRDGNGSVQYTDHVADMLRLIKRRLTCASPVPIRLSNAPRRMSNGPRKIDNSCFSRGNW